MNSRDLFLYVRGDDSEEVLPVQCCLCPQPIVGGEIYFLLEVEGNERRAHHECSMRLMEQVIALRDKRGASEDR